MAHREYENAIQRCDIWAKKRRALELRLAKEPYSRIADELDVSTATAHQWVRELTAIQLPQEDMDDVRAHEAAGYDASEQRVTAMMAMVADIAAERKAKNEPIGYQIEQLNSLEKTLGEVRKQRALLLGINRPVLVKHNVTIRNVLDDEIEALVSELSGGGNIMSDPEMVDLEGDTADD